MIFAMLPESESRAFSFSSNSLMPLPPSFVLLLHRFLDALDKGRALLASHHLREHPL